jgi:hypothetical protein
MELEDLHLVSAWGAMSLDVVTDNDQSGKKIGKDSMISSSFHANSIYPYIEIT